MQQLTPGSVWTYDTTPELDATSLICADSLPSDVASTLFVHNVMNRPHKVAAAESLVNVPVTPAPAT